jgi:hypothetical protein
MGIRIIDRGKTAEVLQERLAFFRNLVASEMHQTQQLDRVVQNDRVEALREKFDAVRSRLTLNNRVNQVAQDIDQNIREMKLGALKAQTGMDLKKLLDLL